MVSPWAGPACGGVCTSCTATCPPPPGTPQGGGCTAPAAACSGIAWMLGKTGRGGEGVRFGGGGSCVPSGQIEAGGGTWRQWPQDGAGVGWGQGRAWLPAAELHPLEAAWTLLVAVLLQLAPLPSHCQPPSRRCFPLGSEPPPWGLHPVRCARSQAGQCPQDQSHPPWTLQDCHPAVLQRRAVHAAPAVPPPPPWPPPPPLAPPARN